MKHIHKYEKVRMGRNGDYIVFRCIEPHCSHYAQAKFVEGKLSICNRCGNPFLMDKAAMLLTKPHCRPCTKPKDIKKKEAIDKLAELMERL